MEKSFKYRIYPNKQQEELIQKTFGCCRFVYNYYLTKRIELYNLSKSYMNYYACSADLTKLKRELAWLKEVDSASLQSSLKDLEVAFKNFYREIKKGNSKHGFPRFKKKKEGCRSYRTTFDDNNIRITDKTIRLPKLGYIKCKTSIFPEGRIISATISQNSSGKYYVSVYCTDVEMPKRTLTGNSVGIDLGIKEFCVTSDGEMVSNPKFFKVSQDKLAKLERALSRKTIGSSNRVKAKRKLARQYEKVANQRKDFLHKLSTGLVRNNDVICIESLQIQNLVKNNKLSTSIHDAAWGEFKRQLQYKSKWYGSRLIQIDTFYASSQICNVCGYANKETKDLSVRKWDCPQCNAHHDRDINAAINILSKGLEQI